MNDYCCVLECRITVLLFEKKNCFRFISLFILISTIFHRLDSAFFFCFLFRFNSIIKKTSTIKNIFSVISLSLSHHIFIFIFVYSFLVRIFIFRLNENDFFNQISFQLFQYLFFIDFSLNSSYLRGKIEAEEAKIRKSKNDFHSISCLSNFT
jgi:hypothetical protein